MIPSLDNVKSLGIVRIPGIMAGMVLSGASPVYAALYQFVVLTMILWAAALTCLVSSYGDGTGVYANSSGCCGEVRLRCDMLKIDDD